MSFLTKKHDYKYGQLYDLSEFVGLVPKEDNFIMYNQGKYELNRVQKGIVIGYTKNEVVDGLVLYNEEPEDSANFTEHLSLLPFLSNFRLGGTVWSVTGALGGELELEGEFGKNKWSYSERAKIILNILSKYDFKTANTDEKEIMTRTRHNMISALVDWAYWEMWDKYKSIEIVRGFCAWHGKIRSGIDYIKSPDVRSIVEFRLASKKIVYEGSLTDAINFYEQKPKQMAEQLYKRQRKAELKKQGKDVLKEKKQEEQKHKESKRKEQHYKL